MEKLVKLKFPGLNPLPIGALKVFRKAKAINEANEDRLLAVSWQNSHFGLKS